VLRRIQATREHLQELSAGEGDLTKRLEADGNDEISDMAVSVNRFIDKVHAIVSEVRDSTLQVASAAEEVAAVSQESSRAIHTQRSATGRATNIMTESHAQTDETVSAARQAQEALQVIATAVSRINDMNTSIANAAEEQSVVADEINQNVNRINDASEQITAGSEQTDTATAELARLAEQLQSQVNQFKL